MRCVVVGALCLALLVPAVAPAEPAAPAAPDEQAARAHFERAERLFAAGRFADALAEYQAAYQADPLPELLFDVGQAQRNLHHVDEANFAYREYLRRLPQAQNRPQVERLLDELEREKAEQARLEAERARRVPLVPPSGQTTTPSSPVYKRWWFWTGIGVVATTAVVLMALPHSRNVPDTTLGNVDFPR